MKKTKIAAVAAGVMVLFSGINVYAATGDSVSAHIMPPVSTLDSSGEITNPDGDLVLYGICSVNSNNQLRVMSKRRLTLWPDETRLEFLLDIGESNSASHGVVSNGTYYLRLENKNYAINRSAIGDGTLSDL